LQIAQSVWDSSLRIDVRTLRSSILYWLAAVAIAAAPFLLTVILVRGAFERTLADFSPFLNDEVAYWHQAATFRAVGFDGGYYSLEEHPAAAGRVHFGLHGPGYAIVYGSIGKFTGWYRDTAPRVNASLLAVALVAFAAVARARLRDLILLGAVATTYWPIAFFLPSNMQEPMHYAAAIVFGGLVGRSLEAREPIPRSLRVSGWIFVSALVLLRPSWVIALPVWAAADIRVSPRRSVALALAGVALGVALTAVFLRVSAPITSSPITTSQLSFSEGIGPVLGRLAYNTRRLGDFEDFKRIEIWHRALYLAAAAMSLVLLARMVVPRSAAPSAVAVRHAVVQAINIWGIVVAMFAAYAIGNMSEIRIIAAHVLFAATVLATRRTRAAYALLVMLIAANAAALPWFLEDFAQVRHDNFRRDLRSQRVLEEIIDPRMVYRAGVDGWCNTLLTAQYPPDLIAIPAGIGLTALREPEKLEPPIKSRYLLLDARTKFVGETLELEHLGDVPYGSVYVNRSASCEALLD
jgi:hypothetical protein